jgi:4-amino-4-deoxy-L-arabinose transferase-like glycosyltransferase
VRVLHLAFVAPTPVLSYHRLFPGSDMHMFDNWAQQIVAGDVLGRRPYHYLSDWQLAIASAERWAGWFGREPTFYKAPFYAYLIAFLYWAFGDAMLPLVLLQILASGAAVFLLFRVSERLLGTTVGLVAALFLALYAPAIHFDVVMLRGPWIVLASLLFTRRLIQLQEEPSPWNAGVLGMAAGALVLVNEGFAPTLVLAAVLVAAWVRDLRRVARLLGVFAAGAAIVLAPVVVRNYVVGSPLFELAVTGSTVYAVFNTAGSSPHFFDVSSPALRQSIEAGGGDLLATVLACLRTFPGPSQVALFYLQKAAGLVIPFENPDNVNFYYVALKSPVLAALPAYGVLFPLALLGLFLLARRIALLAPLLPAVLSLFAAIMLTLPLSRYRATLAVYLMPLAGLAVVRAADWARRRHFAPLAIAVSAAACISLAAAALQSKVVFEGRPAGGYLYRHLEFALGVRFYESQGRLAEASREALDLARLNQVPGTRASALLTVGRLEARQNHRAAASEALAGAARLGDGQPRLLMEVGDVYLGALDDPVQALVAYRAAARTSAPEPLKEQIRSRLARLEGGAAVK